MSIDNNIQVSNHQFLSAIFPDPSLVHTTSFMEDPLNIPQEARGRCWAGSTHQLVNNQLIEGANQYFTISVFGVVDGQRRRRKAQFSECYCIVADDVHDKLPVEEVEKLPLPSWKLETSPGNEQWGWIVRPAGFIPDSREAVENLLDGLVSRGLAPDGKDPGMKGVTRYVRLPEGYNRKARWLNGGGGFKCRMVEWHPERVVSLGALAAVFNIDVGAVRSDGGGEGKALVVEGHPVLKVMHVLSDEGDGKYNVVCPWVDQHTGGDTSGTAIWTYPDGRATIKCHHGHCADKGCNDLMAWAKGQEGWKPEEVDSTAAFTGMTARQTGDLENQLVGLTPATTAGERDALILLILQVDDAIEQEKYKIKFRQNSLISVGALRDRIRQLQHQMRENRSSHGNRGDWLLNSVGARLEHVDNLTHLFSRVGVHLRHNEMTGEIEAPLFPGSRIALEDRENLWITRIEDKCKEHEIGIGRTGALMNVIAREDSYHPMAEYLAKGVWDKVDRIDKVLGCLKQPSGLNQRQVELGRSMFTRWCISAMACTYRYARGRAPRGVLVLVGPQLAGKTTFFEYLCPEGMFLEGQHLKTGDKDNVQLITSSLFVELGEFERSMQSADSAGHIKAFLSNGRDSYRKAYAKGITKRDRRTIYIGTVNHDQFNFDQTGGTRFWPLVVERVDLDTIREMKENGGGEQLQFWLQIKSLFDSGHGYHLTKEEEGTLFDRNKQHIVETDADLALEEVFYLEGECTVKMTRAEVLKEVNKIQKNINLIQVTNALAKKGYVSKQGYRDGIRANYWLVPILRSTTLLNSGTI